MGISELWSHKANNGEVTMEAPNVKSRKVYGDRAHRRDAVRVFGGVFLRESFTGTQTIAYQNGGVRTVETHGRFTLTLEGLADLRAFLKELSQS